MSSVLYILLSFLHKSLSFITGLFRSLFDSNLFTSAGRTTRSDAPGTGVQTHTLSRRPKGLKSLVLPQNVAPRQLEDIRRRVAETTPSRFVSFYQGSANSSLNDPELGHCNVVELLGSPPLFYSLSSRLQSATPSTSPCPSRVLQKHSPGLVSYSSLPSVCNALGYSNKKSSPCDADLSVSPSSACLKLWTSSPQGKQPLSPFRLNFSSSPLAGEKRSYCAPYFNGAPSIASTNNIFDFTIYTSSPHFNVEHSIVSDSSEEAQEDEKPKLEANTSPMTPKPANKFTLRPSYSARTPGHGERSFQMRASSISSASPMSFASEWSPGGLFTSHVRRGTSSSSCSAAYPRSLSESCITSLCDLPASAEIGGIRLDSVPRDPVSPVGWNLVPETVPCPDIPGFIDCAAGSESEVSVS